MGELVDNGWWKEMSDRLDAYKIRRAWWLGVEDRLGRVCGDISYGS